MSHTTPNNARTRASSPLRLVATALSLLTLAGCGAESASDWPQWRGPGGLGISDTHPLPSTWSETSPNLRWRTELPGVGNSSPIVAGPRIYLTTSLDDPDSDGDERLRVVLGLDRKTGELLWQRPLFSAPAERRHRLNTVAAPTPVSDGERVWVYFGSVLASLDRDGELLWQHEIDPSYAEFTRYGAASSPVLSERAVLVVQDKEWARTEDVGWLAAFDRATGERLWRTEWTETCCSYATPLVVRRGATEEILFAHSGMVRSYDAATGEPLWSHEVPILQMVSTPVLIENTLAVSGGAHNVKHTVLLELAGAGADTVVRERWSSPRFAPQNSSPVLYRNRLVTVTDQGVVAGYAVATGELLWSQRLTYARNRASLVAGDGKIYVSSTSGWISVLEASDTFRLLAENHLGEPGSNASPAIADGCLLLRTKRHLVCVEASADAT